MTLTFDLLISKWGHDRVTSVMGFLPANFELAMPFHSRLMVRHRTDRRTTAINALCLHLVEVGHIQIINDPRVTINNISLGLLDVSKWLIC